MPKLTREPPAVACPRERPDKRTRGAASRIRHSKKHAAARKHRKRSKGDPGSSDMRDVLRQLTEEVRRGGAGRSEELVSHRQAPVQSGSRRREAQ